MDEPINLDDFIESDEIPKFCYSSKEELNKKLMEAYEDVLAGRVEPAEKVFADLSREFNSWITK